MNSVQIGVVESRVVVSDLALHALGPGSIPVGELAGVEFRNLCLDIYLG